MRSPPAFVARRVLARKGLSMEFSALLTPALEGGFVALHPESGTTTQGETSEEARVNLREATQLFLEEFPHKLGPRASRPPVIADR